MKHSTRKGSAVLRYLLLVLWLHSTAFFAAPLVLLTLDSDFLFGLPGSAVAVTGTILNTSGVEVFLNGAGGDLSSTELTLDLTNFFTFVPFSLLDGQSYTGDIFSVAISNVALSGDYLGSFSIQGGADAFTYDIVSSQSFHVGVADATTVPEPSAAVPLGIVVVIVAVRRFWMHPQGAARRPASPCTDVDQQA